MVYTENSRLVNMIEIEFSVLTHQCLQRCIPTVEGLETEVLALIARGREKQIKINWKFSIDVCLEKLNWRYSVINDANLKFAKL